MKEMWKDLIAFFLFIVCTLFVTSTFVMIVLRFHKSEEPRVVTYTVIQDGQKFPGLMIKDNTARFHDKDGKKHIFYGTYSTHEETCAEEEHDH